MARSSASVPDVEFGLRLALGLLAVLVEVEPPPLLVVLDEGVGVPVGMSDAGTAEIGDAAWAPVGGL